MQQQKQSPIKRNIKNDTISNEKQTELKNKKQDSSFQNTNEMTSLSFTDNQKNSSENLIQSDDDSTLIIEEKELKQTQTYNKIFEQSLFIDQNILKSFICPLCQGILDDATLEYCGCMKVYCKNCLKLYREMNKNKCPFTGNVCLKEPESFPLFNKILSNYEMKCHNFNKGCQWVGKYNNYKNHLKNECLKENVKCPNEKCNLIILRENLEKHLNECLYKKIKFDLCHNYIEFNLLEKHLNECKKTKINCPQGCNMQIERSEMENHLSTSCQNKIINCPFEKLGCTDTFQKKYLEKRIENDRFKHEMMLVNLCSELKNQNERFKVMLYLLSKNYENLKSSGINKKKSLELKSKNDNDNDIQNMLKDEYYLNSNKKIEKNKIDIIELNEEEGNKEKKQLNEKNKSKNSSTIKSNKTFLLKKTKNSDNNENKINPNISYNKNKLNNFSDISTTNYNKNSQNKNLQNTICNAKMSDSNNNNQNYNQANLLSNIFDIFSVKSNLFKLENNNTITAYGLYNGYYNYFIFLDKKYNISKNSEKYYVFSIKLLNNIKWLGIGICDKKIVEENKFKFSLSNDTNSGCYLLCVNGTVWNSNKNSECKKIDESFIGKKGNIIECQFYPKNRSMKFSIDNKIIARLSDIKLFKSDSYTPCLLFRENCSVEVIIK